MDGISKLIGSLQSFGKSAWDENTASSTALVFIPCLLVAASRFPVETVMFDDGTHCYWLLVDALIVSFTISALAAVVDICLDIGYFLNKVPKDSVPLIAGGDKSYPKANADGSWDGTLVSRIVFALIIRAIGSCFFLLTLSSATVLTLVPLTGQNTTAASTALYPYPPQCALLSDNVYNYKLFFGFGAIAVVFIALRVGLVVQSSPLEGAKSDNAKAADHAEKGVKVPPAITKSDPHEHELEEVKPSGAHEEEDDASEEEREERRRKKRHRRKHRKEKRRERRDDDDEEEGSGDDKEEKEEHSSS